MTGSFLFEGSSYLLADLPDDLDVDGAQWHRPALHVAPLHLALLAEGPMHLGINSHCKCHKLLTHLYILLEAPQADPGAEDSLKIDPRVKEEHQLQMLH